MQIVLLRHGKPRIRTDVRLSPAELPAWIAEYNSAGIDAALPPPQESIDRVKGCTFSVGSDLPRSVESARALGIERLDLCESMFRELELPHARWHFPRLLVIFWAVLFRLMWTLGYSANGEPIGAGRARATRCAERLSELAAEHGTVVFIGHGSLNWFIARRLMKAGWTGPEHSPRRYWEFSVYSLASTTDRE